MTVITTKTVTQAIANGIVTSFGFDFQVLDPTWVFASERLPGGSIVDRLDITVVLNSNQEVSPGGTVIFSVAPTDLSTVIMFRVIPSTQEQDYNEYDAFPAQSHENALDKLTMLLQGLGSLLPNFPVSINALGFFDGQNVNILSGSGFSSFIRTATGHYEIGLTVPIAIDFNMLTFISGPTFGPTVLSYNVGRKDDATLAVQVSYIPNGTDVVNTAIDSVFQIIVFDASIPP